MSGTQAGSGPAGSAEPSGKRGSWLWLQGLACGAFVTLATPTALLAGALLAPSLLTLWIDRSPGRPVARTVMLFGLAASVHPIWSLWRSAGSVGTALGLAQDTSGLAAAWAAQAAGWLLTEMVPLVVRIGLETAAVARLATLKIQRHALCEAWGFTADAAKPKSDKGKP